MDEAAEITTRTQRFNDAARTFTPPSPTRHAKLVPFKDGIVEQRQKGASLRLIRELLATADVAVGTDTIARFLAEINDDPIPPQLVKRNRQSAPGCSETGSPSTPPSPDSHLQRYRSQQSR